MLGQNHSNNHTKQIQVGARELTAKERHQGQHHWPQHSCPTRESPCSGVIFFQFFENKKMPHQPHGGQPDTCLWHSCVLTLLTIIFITPTYFPFLEPHPSWVLSSPDVHHFYFLFLLTWISAFSLSPLPIHAPCCSQRDLSQTNLLSSFPFLNLSRYKGAQGLLQLGLTYCSMLLINIHLPLPPLCILNVVTADFYSTLFPWILHWLF